MKAIDNFIYAIQQERFVEAHELLENDWQHYKKINLKNEAKVLKGLINGATALALFVKGRKEPCLRVWSTFNKYKPLLNTTKLDDKDRFIYAKDLLEKKFIKITNL